MKNARAVTIQAGAIPFRQGRGGRLEILLIRRVNKRKWGIPKGMVEHGQSPPDNELGQSQQAGGALHGNKAAAGAPSELRDELLSIIRQVFVPLNVEALRQNTLSVFGCRFDALLHSDCITMGRARH